MLTAADRWLIVILLGLAMGGIGMSAGASWGTGKYAIISVAGEKYATVQLKAGYRQEIRIGGERYYDLIEVADGRVRVREADCPNQDCVKTGWISRPPQQIVCLPYRIVIKIVSDEQSLVDAITG